MLSLRLACFVCLAFAVSEITGQYDFDLGEALDDPVPTKKPVPTRKPNADGDLHLEDAFGDDMATSEPKPTTGGGNATSSHAFPTAPSRDQHPAGPLEKLDAILGELRGYRAEMREDISAIRSEMTLLRQLMNKNTHMVELINRRRCSVG